MSSTPPAGTIETLPYNVEAVVSITTWFLMVASILAIVARMSTKVALSRKVTPDDVTIFIALAFSIGQTIAVSVQSASGIGQHTNALSPTEIGRYEKASRNSITFKARRKRDVLTRPSPQASYAADILFIMTVMLSKISVLLLIVAISPVLLHLRLARTTSFITIAWGLSSVLVAAFKCKLPHPWAFMNGHCINTTAFWNYFAALNIVTDALLMIIPLCILWTLATSIKRRAVIFVCFSGRFVVIGAIIAQIYYQNKDTVSDPTFTDWPAVLASVIVQNLAIITSCIPYLKPLLESLESGMIRSDDLRRKQGGSYKMGLSTTGSSFRMNTSWPGSKASRNRKLSEQANKNVVDLGPGRTEYEVSGGKPPPGEFDRDSQRSQSRMIRETRTWNVESSEAV